MAKGMSLSIDQKAARNAVISAIDNGEEVTVLVGPAGSGKTTLMRAIVDDLASTGREVVLVCPTGKAASVLAAKTGADAMTIHKAMYQSVMEDEDTEDLVFGDPKAPCGNGGIVVCDEASMVGMTLHAALLEQLRRRHGAQLLYVGDREQLPPVNEPWGPDFDIPTAALDRVHRQAEGSPILGLATAIRTRGPWFGWVPGVCDRVREDPVAWMVERADRDATLLCYTNKTRQRLNREIRAALGYREAIEPGDRLVCLLNNHAAGVMNGQVLTVTRIRYDALSAIQTGAPILAVTMSNGQTRHINADLIGGRAADFKRFTDFAERRGVNPDKLLHVDYGFALTVHKSQGSQWDDVGFVGDGGYDRLKRKDPDTARRLAYTAVTRAAERLRIFEVER